jgi:predicted permease
MIVAGALARALLYLYPPSFRREMGAALVGDVRRRAGTRAGLRFWLWLIRLTGSLVGNAVAAWAEKVTAVARASVVSILDLKLAFRMLVRYPGLTLTGGLGIAVAVAVGVGFFALLHSRFYPVIPLPDGERLVGLENWDRSTHREERRALQDFLVWRAEMKSVEDITAFRDVTRNAIAPDGSVEVAQVAEITPAGFRLTRVPPLLGRGLVDADATPGAPPVVVIGADVWRGRFASDPRALGRQLRLGRTMHSVVGVMPEGFAFPVNHRYWIPMAEPRPDASRDRRGPQLYIAGRLAPGFSLTSANAELAAIGTRMAAAFPQTHEHLRPEVVPYAYPFAGMSRSSADMFWPGSVLVGLILVVVSVNVAILVYARTATRLGELAVRSALGASRARLVGQLCAESCVLSTAAAVIGVLLAKVALDWTRAGLSTLQQANFWSDYTLSGAGVGFGIALAVLAAVITGLVPALRATRRRADLRRFTPGALRLGRTWTTLIIVQVSIASAALPAAVGLGWFQVRDIFNLPRFPVNEIVFADVTLDRESVAPGQDLARMQEQLSLKLDETSTVVRHAFLIGLPNIGRGGRIVIENDPAPPGTSHQIQPATVDVNFFRTFDVNVLAGREFAAGDFGGGAPGAVLVNRAFVDRVLLGGSALGRRIRFDGDAQSRWREIVGVVENIDANPFGDALSAPRVYQPLMNAERTRASLAVRIAESERGGLARRLPEIAAGIDPALQVRIGPFEDLYRLQRLGLTTAAIGIGVALLSVILLSSAGIYALMSFTVTQRRREIAIRTALGAQPRRLLGGIFGQAARRLSAGVVIGAGLVLLLDYSQDGEVLAGHAGSVVPLVIGVMIAVGLAAAFGPARRGLRIEPVEALKGE